VHLASVSVQILPDGCQRLTLEVEVEGRTNNMIVVRTFERGVSLSEAAGRLHQLAYELTAREVSCGRG